MIENQNPEPRTQKKNRYALFVAGLIAFAGVGRGDELTREIFKELVEINTTESSGSVTKASEAMAARLRTAGFPADDVLVVGDDARKKNLVARMRGSGRAKPVLLLAHLDVVEALPADWTVDPFKLTEKDGFFYGRGTIDDKAMAAIWIRNLIRYRSEGFVPDRDIIVALTADEESGNANGIDWLLKNHRSLIDAEMAINEGGGGKMEQGRKLYNGVQASEKIYVTFRLEVKNRGGHSSVPRRDNAIYQLAAGLLRLSRYRFPVHLNEVTRTYFERTSKILKETGVTEKDDTGAVSAGISADMAAVARTGDPGAAERLSRTSLYNALLRTTCVATELEGGHAENALPQTARATVNCRVLPNESGEDVLKTLNAVLNDPEIVVTWVWKPQPSPPSPLRPDVMQAIESTTAEMWPGVPVMPLMATGATDGLYLRGAGIPTYGVSGVFTELDDNRSHGKDERIGVREFDEAREFLYRLVKKIALGPTR